jgi:hypothetical protein
MNSQLYRRLTDVVAAQSTVHYSELAEFLGLDMSSPDDRFRLGAMLDEINHAEHNAGRPMISAVVVHAQESLPGAGFFVCARELAVLGTRNRQDELAFFVEELRRVHAYWGHADTAKSGAHPRGGR